MSPSEHARAAACPRRTSVGRNAPGQGCGCARASRGARRAWRRSPCRVSDVEANGRLGKDQKLDRFSEANGNEGKAELAAKKLARASWCRNRSLRGASQSPRGERHGVGKQIS
eukprot:ctg_3354.g592